MTEEIEPDDDPPMHPILLASALVLLCLLSAWTGYLICEQQYFDVKCILRNGNVEIEVR
jgi:hypothetical protein